MMRRHLCLAVALAAGGRDVIARTLAESMRSGLGQQIVVDNRPGAATNIGAEAVARSKADGYTVMSADNALMAFHAHAGVARCPHRPGTGCA